MAKQNVLVVVSHPDDELLGCGGALAKHTSERDAVHILIVAEGVTSRDDKRDAEVRSDDLEALKQCSIKVAQFLGAQPPLFGGMPDNRLDSIDLLDVVKLVEQVVEQIQPTIIYTHHGHDLNVDHRIVHEAVMTACRPIPGCSVETILLFETVSSTEWRAPGHGAFTPNWFVDISRHLERKLSALDIYRGEMREWPHARSLEAISSLAKWRGSSVGVGAAEAFSLVRNVIKK